VTESATRVVPRKATRGALAFYAVCRFITVGASIIYFPGGVKGKEHLPKTGAYVLAPVHRSYVDWLVVARVTRRRLRYIVKGEVWKSRFVGWLLEALGAFPVHRDAPDREALNQAILALEGGEPLVIFPEGTRRTGRAIVDVREGAAYLALRAGVPVVPVGIFGTEQAMARGKKFPRPARVRIVIGPALVPEDRTNEDGSSRRVARSATHAFSEALTAAIQEAFDEATRG
jgi:1-acyl-sn-glycerol-3-phosphate acyltransferase